MFASSVPKSTLMDGTLSTAKSRGFRALALSKTFVLFVYVAGAK
jgi:hypothetical protein